MEGLRQAATLGRGALGHTRAIATMVVRGKRLGEELQRADCEVMIRGAQRLGLPAAVAKDSATPYVAAGFGMSGDQRHRAVVNGLWEIGHGFQLSGIYFFRSVMRYVTTNGVDRRNEGVGGAAPSLRLRADGSIMPRNALVGEPIHRVDMRVQKRFPIAGRVAIDGIMEVFICSITRTTARTWSTRAARNTDSRRSMPTSPISRGCCSARLPRDVLSSERIGGFFLLLPPY